MASDLQLRNSDMRAKATINLVFALLVVVSLLLGPASACAMCVKPPTHPCCPKTPAKSPSDCGQSAALMNAPTAINQANSDSYSAPTPSPEASEIPQTTWEPVTTQRTPPAQHDAYLTCRQLRL